MTYLEAARSPDPENYVHLTLSEAGNRMSIQLSAAGMKLSGHSRLTKYNSAFVNTESQVMAGCRTSDRGHPYP